MTDPATDSATDSVTLARDWITLWRSELAAIAEDREVQEHWRALLALWARSAAAMVPADDPARPAAPARPAPAAAASDPRCAEIERLGRRVAELEARIDALERDRTLPARRTGRRRAANAAD